MSTDLNKTRMSDELVRASALANVSRLRSGRGFTLDAILEEAERVVEWLRTGER